MPKSAVKRPLKVLHIVESLDKGAVESWLLRVHAHAAAEERHLNWAFYCHLTVEGVNAEQVRRVGGEVFSSPVPLSDATRFMAALRKTVQVLRPDVIHMHHDVLSGLYLIAITGLGCRTIVHIHNRALCVPVRSPVKAALIGKIFRNVCFTADRLVANSEATLERFLAGRCRRLDRDLVLYCGIDPAPFRHFAPSSRLAIRQEWGVSANSPILLFAGRLVPEKNPHLVVEIISRLHGLGFMATAVFIGDGPCRTEALTLASLHGLQNFVKWVGYQQDVAPCMQAADCFVLPSSDLPGEGFGLAVVEAQLAGLPVLISNGVPVEALLPGATYRRLSTNEPLDLWASAAAELLKRGRQPADALVQQFETSDLSLARSAELMVALHQEVAA